MNNWVSNSYLNTVAKRHLESLGVNQPVNILVKNFGRDELIVNVTIGDSLPTTYRMADRDVDIQIKSILSAFIRP